MASHVWEDVLSEQDERVITAAGYDTEGASSWESRGLGDRPALLVIDVQRKSAGRDVPITEAVEDYRTAMGEIAWAAIDEIRELVGGARENGVPVTFTRSIPTTYDDPGHEALRIVDPLTPREVEDVVTKSYASAFYGTDLLTRLVRDGVDTLVLAGTSTSGCVRATAVDAQQRGFDVVVPHECVFDRIQASHKVALLDMWMKYAEVTGMEDVLEYFSAVGEGP